VTNRQRLLKRTNSGHQRLPGWLTGNRRRKETDIGVVEEAVRSNWRSWWNSAFEEVEMGKEEQEREN
jgi:hypothetical protein